MYKKYIRALAVLGVLAAIGLSIAGWLYVRNANVALLNPAGHIAERESHLMMFAAALSLVVVVPVFALLFGIAWRYRASNTKATYKPDWDHNNWYESAWWLIPTCLILVLSVVTWNSSHELDPYRKLAGTAKPLQVQVVALNWKWLFIYPEQNLATVSYLTLPQNRPVEFTITSDATMNSFWIPQLGGQIYAMTGMSTKLHLLPEQIGTFTGASANISGEGFAHMTFKTNVVSQPAFDDWVAHAKRLPPQVLPLSQKTYKELAEPTQGYAPTTYPRVDKDLFDSILMKYMKTAPPTAAPKPEEHTDEHQHTMPMSGMDHMDM